MYSIAISLALGSSKAGLTDLRAQLVDTSGNNVGSEISTGFVDMGSGNYLWYYASMPDGHRGAVKFYSAAAPSTILAVAAINPEEAENTDVKVSTRSDHTPTQVADEVLKRDWTQITGEAARSVLNALRFLRNRWAVSSNTLTVYQEDDATAAWTATVTDNAAANPITESDPT